MNEDKFLEILKDVLNTDCGYELIQEMLEKLGALERGCNFDNTNMEYYNRGKRDRGLWLLDLVRKADLNKFEEILIKRG